MSADVETIVVGAGVVGLAVARALALAGQETLEPEVACVGALVSPSTGIIDSHGFMLALEGHIEANGGSVVLQCPVERVERDAAGLFRLTTGGSNPGAITCRHLVISAGLHASK